MPTAKRRRGAAEDTLGGRISFARESAGLSEEEAARRLGVLAESWIAWERDRDAPRANRITTMAGVLGVSLSWLIGGAGDGPPDRPAAGAPEDRAELLRELRRASRDVAALNQRMNEIAEGLERLKPASPEPARAG